MSNIFGTMFSGVTATGAQSSAGPDARQYPKSFHGYIAGSGNITATIVVQASNFPTAPTLAGQWVTVGTITLSGSAAVSDGFASEAPWQWYRGNITAMSNVNTVAALYVGS